MVSTSGARGAAWRPCCRFIIAQAAVVIALAAEGCDMRVQVSVRDTSGGSNPLCNVIELHGRIVPKPLHLHLGCG